MSNHTGRQAPLFPRLTWRPGDPFPGNSTPSIRRVGIVGSRTRRDRFLVQDLVRALRPGITVVSGGCEGPDKWAAAEARRRGLDVVEHLPDLAGVRNRGEAARRYHARNQVVVDDVDALVAFVSADRKGGTEDTIARADARGLPVLVLWPLLTAAGPARPGPDS